MMPQNACEQKYIKWNVQVMIDEKGEQVTLHTCTHCTFIIQPEQNFVLLLTLTTHSFSDVQMQFVFTLHNVYIRAKSAMNDWPSSSFKGIKSSCKRWAFVQFQLLAEAFLIPYKHIFVKEISKLGNKQYCQC